ncbi:MAG: hypothetical protein IT378_07880 [Sandaracinaceae bacterium]|nr:hypothetical protein [Sandaracinaceae bacterium]
MPVTDVAERLANLARRLSAEGFAARDAPFFSDVGIVVAVRPDATMAMAGGIPVIEAMVFVYAIPEAWQLRVTQHGGPHWLRNAASERELENVVRDYQSAPARPPGPGWREV